MTADSRLRVLLADASDRGGIARYSAALRAGLVSAGAEVVLAAPAPAGDPEALLHPLRWGPDMAGRRRSAVYLRRATEVLPAARALLGALRRTRPDVAHFQSEIVPGVDHLLLQLAGRSCPVVVTVHDPVPLEGGARAVADQARRWRAADALIVHADDQRFFVEASAPGVTVHVVPVDLPLGGAPLGRAESRRRLGLAPEAPVALLLGQVRPYKGLRLLSEAWPLVTKELPAAQLLVVGETYPSDDLARLRATPSVRVVEGFLSEEDLDRWASAADLVVLPYSAGGHSGILHRALAAGTPVIAAPSLAEEVWRTHAGVVVPLQTQSWADALVAALGSSPIPAPKTPAGSETVSRTLEVYDEVLSRRSPRRRRTP
ncbi:MAG TPA: glycosyltransferase [Acidimicrobiales bacterium]|nr:glycosyltransferase [Acidimicrobiales bacterium]